MTNTKRLFTAVVLAGAALTAPAAAHAADPVFNTNDGLAIEFIRTDSWGPNEAHLLHPDSF
ncbi:hypothetical protein ACWGFX_01885 [Streptomyces xanthophaeus]